MKNKEYLGVIDINIAKEEKICLPQEEYLGYCPSDINVYVHIDKFICVHTFVVSAANISRVIDINVAKKRTTTTTKRRMRGISSELLMSICIVYTYMHV